MKRMLTSLLARLRPTAKPMPQTDRVADLKSAMQAAAAEGLNPTVVGRSDWAVATFEISCQSGFEPMTGLVKGAFAIHPLGFAWTLTHLPTGLGIVAHPSVIRLFSLAERLAPMPHWNTVRKQDLDTPPIVQRVSAEIQAWHQEAT